MSNIFAIAQKELRSYFFSPIAYVVVGLFVFVFGWFFVSNLAAFIRFSLQAGMFSGGPQVLNINEHLIRPVLTNMGLILVFLLPMVTMRSYAEEKRSGTIELLLSSPLTDLQVILGKFLGALALYTLMLAVTLVHMGILFLYGEPELLPVLSGYLGLWLMGGAFISIGLFVSSQTRNQMVAGIVSLVVLLILWVATWMEDPAGGIIRSQVLPYLSIPDHYDDFSKGVIDTEHLTYFISFILLGLFLTARSVDSERWRG
jgi:ABC-2 type transport system permease protein